MNILQYLEKLINNQDFILGVFASLVAAFIIWIIKQIITCLQERSDFNGKWETCLYDTNNAIVKRDITKVKHNKKTNWLYGKVGRAFPLNQIYRKWKMTGLLVGDNIICLVWSKQIITSFNCAYFHQTKDYYYDGYYLKFNNKSNQIEKCKITLSKIDRKFSIKQLIKTIKDYFKQ